MVLAMFLMALVAYEGQYSNNAFATDNVTYRFPYLNTAPASAAGGGTIYCVASNFTSTAATVTFTSRTSSGSGTLGTVATDGLAANTTQMYIFATNTIGKSGNTTPATVPGITADAGVTSYGGDLSFGSTSANSAAAGTALNCNTLLVGCFQGGSTPKRNLVGYGCMYNTDVNDGITNSQSGANKYAPLAATYTSVVSSNNTNGIIAY